MEEKVTMQVELLDAKDGKVCVEFRRQMGSAMIFYEQYNILRKLLAFCNNVIL